MKAYLDLCQRILDTGVKKSDRTGTGTIAVFGHMLHFDLTEGFPLVTTKKVHLKSIIHELLWFLKGETNVKYLKDNGVSIWDEWADEYGELGPVYGSQWRSWPDPNSMEVTGEVTGSGEEHKRTVTVTMGVIDQITEVIEQIKTNPDSRRHLVSAWNVAEIKRMKLPPCHFAFQFGVYEGRLSCMMNMRSVDVFLGMPFNIASYALLTMMVAQVTGLTPGELVISTADTHIYLNHIEQVKLQLTREPRPLPKMVLNGDVHHIDSFRYEDFRLIGYDPHPAIKGVISV